MRRGRERTITTTKSGGFADMNTTDLKASKLEKKDEEEEE